MQKFIDKLIRKTTRKNSSALIMESYMNDLTKKPGFVLVFTIVLIALLMILAIKIMDTSRVYRFYTSTMIDRENAKILAFSGLQIGITQLAIVEEKTKSKKESTTKEMSSQVSKSDSWTLNEAKEFIKNVFPLLNRWQIFALNYEKYGVDGIIKICLGSEEGKIDINEYFDFKNHKFIGEGKGVSEDFKFFFKNLFKEINKFIKGKDLFKKFESYLSKPKEFEQFLKNRQNRLYDPTEFLNLKGFEAFKDIVFFRPFDFVNSKNEEKDEAGIRRDIYWTDIFTVWSGTNKVNPWLFSNSIKKLFGLKFKEEEKIGAIKQKISDLIKYFKLNLSWPDDWDRIFETLYGMKYNSLPKWVTSRISTTFEPKIFSVLSYGTVGNVTQKLFVVLERKKIQKGKKIVIEFDIKKIYWI